MGFRYVVRQAKQDDCSDILRLIKELAEFEGENPDRVVENTEQGLRNDSFGDHAYFHCLVAEAVEEEEPAATGTTATGTTVTATTATATTATATTATATTATATTATATTVAYALYFCAYSTKVGRLLYLEDLYIQQPHRGNLTRDERYTCNDLCPLIMKQAKLCAGTVSNPTFKTRCFAFSQLNFCFFFAFCCTGRGLGKALVCKVAQIGAGQGCRGMQWLVQETNVGGRRFYDRLNAVDLTRQGGWRVIGARGENFTNLANSFKTPASKKGNIHFLC